MQNTEHPWYTIRNVQEIDSPALLVYPDRVRANIRSAIQMVVDVSRLRPHVKTHKSPEATRMQIGEGITRFKCATIAEAEMLAREGAEDVLLAYQPVGPKVLRLRALVQKYLQTKFSCLVDDVTAVRDLSAAFAGERERLPVYLDLNVGMNRTGILPDESAMELYRACMAMDGIRMAGLHAYDGHIQDRDLAVRTRRCNDAFARVMNMREALTRLGVDPPAIVAGGSPTFPIHVQRPDVECSPGTFIYWDQSYLDDLPEQPFLPAALLMTRVVSRPTGSTLCLDLGHKSVAAEKDIRHRVHFLNAPGSEVMSQSEEHLLVSVPAAGEFAVGHVFYGLPYHICPTCALYDRAVTVYDHEARGEWTMVARRRSIGL